jgi:hypothetical protein
LSLFHLSFLGFRKLYDRGDFPISVNHDGNGNKINWKVKRFLIHNFSYRLILKNWIIIITFLSSFLDYAKQKNHMHSWLDKAFMIF